MPILSSSDLTISVPDPDAIRAAIDVTDERARLLRRLLRLAMRLQLNLTTADQLAPPPGPKTGGDHVTR